jgi:hypothetical protein
MARRIKGQGRFSNRQKTWFWILATTAVVIGLLYWEQIALLYVLATLSMTTLLLVVAVSDLSGAQTVAVTSIPGDEPRRDAGAIGVPPRRSTR